MKKTFMYCSLLSILLFSPSFLSAHKSDNHNEDSEQIRKHGAEEVIELLAKTNKRESVFFAKIDLFKGTDNLRAFIFYCIDDVVIQILENDHSIVYETMLNRNIQNWYLSTDFLVTGKKYKIKFIISPNSYLIGQFEK